jgi:hypothetical protein
VIFAALEAVFADARQRRLAAEAARTEAREAAERAREQARSTRAMRERTIALAGQLRSVTPKRRGRG